MARKARWQHVDDGPTWKEAVMLRIGVALTIIALACLWGSLHGCVQPPATQPAPTLRDGDNIRPVIDVVDETEYR